MKWSLSKINNFTPVFTCYDDLTALSIICEPLEDGFKSRDRVGAGCHIPVAANVIGIATQLCLYPIESWFLGRMQWHFKSPTVPLGKNISILDQAGWI